VKFPLKALVFDVFYENTHISGYKVVMTVCGEKHHDDDDDGWLW